MCSWRQLYIHPAVGAGNLLRFLLGVNGSARSLKEDFLTAWPAKPHAFLVQSGQLIVSFYSAGDLDMFAFASRLPVRTLLFQCSVCSHGGHQACYQRYYMQRPMVELPTSFHMISEIRGRPVTRNILSNGGDDDDMITVNPPETSSPSPRGHTKLIGHPCASGCGHFCWAANGNLDV